MTSLLSLQSEIQCFVKLDPDLFHVFHLLPVQLIMSLMALKNVGAMNSTLRDGSNCCTNLITIPMISFLKKLQDNIRKINF